MAVARGELEGSIPRLGQGSPCLAGNVVDPAGNEQVGGGGTIAHIESANLAEVDLGGNRRGGVAGDDQLLAQVREIKVPEGPVRSAGRRERSPIMQGEVAVHRERGVVGGSDHCRSGIQTECAEAGTGSHDQRSAGNRGGAVVTKGAVERQISCSGFGQADACKVRVDGDWLASGDGAGFQRQTIAGDRVARRVEAEIADCNRPADRDGTGTRSSEDRVVGDGIGPGRTGPVEVGGVPDAGGRSIVPGQIAARRKRILNDLEGIDLGAPTPCDFRIEGNRVGIGSPCGRDHKVLPILVGVLGVP